MFFKPLKKFVTIALILVSWLIYAFSFFTFRNKKVWIFVGWHRDASREVFADNPKYMFLHVSNRHPEIRAIWIAKDKKMAKVLQNHGYTSYSIYSLPGIYYSLKAGYSFFGANIDLENWRLCGRTKVVQLWHGDGVKEMSLITHNSNWSVEKFKKIFLAPGLLRKFHFTISSSDYTAENFICPSFSVDKQEVQITGLPRYDVLFENVPGSEIDINHKLYDQIRETKKKGGKRMFLYAPTFRRGEDPSSPLSQLNFEILESFLRKHNYYLVVSLHPKFSRSRWIPEEKFEHIIFSEPGLDKFPFFKSFDIVITDYSSIFIEFLLMNKAVIFYTYDLEEYSKNQGLHKTFWSDLPPTTRAYTFYQLTELLREDPHKLKKTNSKLRDRLFKYKDAKNSERITKIILNEMV